MQGKQATFFSFYTKTQNGNGIENMFNMLNRCHKTLLHKNDL